MKQTGEYFSTSFNSPDNHAPDGITIDTKERYGRGLRWKLGIATTPCVQSRKSKRCVFCGFLNNKEPVAPHEVGPVFNAVFNNGDLQDIRRLELYVSGSFFDDEEVSFDSRLEIIKAIQRADIKEVVLESRPEFITEENIQALADHISPERITIAVGVETADDGLRRRLSKDFSFDDLTASVSRIARAGMSFQAYLLLKPPAIKDDREAIADIIRSSQMIISLAAEMECPLILAIQPFFLARNSIAAQDAPLNNHVRPPWLYSVALTVKLLTLMRSGDGSNYRIILGNEVDNVDVVLTPSNYSGNSDVCSCSAGIRESLREINISRDKMEENVDRILGLPCFCKTAWQNEIGVNPGQPISIDHFT
jgi:radical SAM enzyme (TIGR01210 family)